MNNPQAFPKPHSVDDVDGDISYPAHAGMTLRDYFAAKAMQALMDDVEDISRTKLWIAITAYSMADAMLEERK
jgi:hypothetical protein